MNVEIGGNSRTNVQGSVIGQGDATTIENNDRGIFVSHDFVIKFVSIFLRVLINF